MRFLPNYPTNGPTHYHYGPGSYVYPAGSYVNPTWSHVYRSRHHPSSRNNHYWSVTRDIPNYNALGFAKLAAKQTNQQGKSDTYF